MRECERQQFAGEEIVIRRFVVENGDIEIVCLSRLSGSFVILLVTSWKRILCGYEVGDG